MKTGYEYRIIATRSVPFKQRNSSWPVRGAGRGAGRRPLHSRPSFSWPSSRHPSRHVPHTPEPPLTSFVCPFHWGGVDGGCGSGVWTGGVAVGCRQWGVDGGCGRWGGWDAGIWPRPRRHRSRSHREPGGEAVPMGVRPSLRHAPARLLALRAPAPSSCPQGSDLGITGWHGGRGPRSLAVPTR